MRCAFGAIGTAARIARVIGAIGVLVARFGDARAIAGERLLRRPHPFRRRLLVTGAATAERAQCRKRDHRYRRCESERIGFFHGFIDPRAGHQKLPRTPAEPTPTQGSTRPVFDSLLLPLSTKSVTPVATPTPPTTKPIVASVWALLASE